VSVEVIVLDDSPEASARSVVEAFNDPRVRYIAREVPSQGRPAIVRNEGMRLARGRYLYFLDDDDHVLPGGLRALVSALEEHPEAGVAFGRVECFGTDPDVLRRYRAWFDWAGDTAFLVAKSSWLTVG